MSKHQPIPLDTIFSEAWKQVKGAKRSFFFAFFTLVVSELLIYFVVGLLEHGQRTWQGDIATFVLLAVITAPLLAGLCMLAVNRFRTSSIHFTDGFKYYRMTLPMVAAFSMGWITLWIVGIIATVSATFLAILLHMQINLQTIPLKIYAFCGVVFVLFYITYKTFLLFNYILVAEKKVNPFLAWWKSCTMAWPHFGKIFITLLYLLLLNLLGICLLGIGLLWSIPFSYLVIGRIYLFCANEHNAVTPTTVAE